jgi:hypothetical protein
MFYYNRFLEIMNNVGYKPLVAKSNHASYCGSMQHKRRNIYIQKKTPIVK